MPRMHLSTFSPRPTSPTSPSKGYLLFKEEVGFHILLVFLLSTFFTAELVWKEVAFCCYFAFSAAIINILMHVLLKNRLPFVFFVLVGWGFTSVFYPNRIFRDHCENS